MLIIVMCLKAKAEVFTYQSGLVIQAQDFKTAARLCFNRYTKGKYPGEEKGLEIIDVCVNPVKRK